MSEFRKYDHVERLGHPDVDGLVCGTVHVFPKLDGSNGSAWFVPGTDVLACASRRLVLDGERENHGFRAWVQGDGEERLSDVLREHRDWILYGEWLVPHTLKTYREDTWRRFWIFDVYDVDEGQYLPFERYEPVLRAAGLDVVEPLCTITNPTDAQLLAQVEANTYLVRDGAGVGEGIVLKNYAWRNRWGRQPWAKIVRTEFKERNRRVFGTTHKDGEFQVEVAIAEEFCTPALVGKTRAKVVADVAQAEGIDLCEPNAQRLVEGTFRGRVIPQLLGRVYHDLVAEECWAFVKKHRNPTVDFKRLQAHVIARVKEYAADLFE